MLNHQKLMHYIILTTYGITVVTLLDTVTMVTFKMGYFTVYNLHYTLL